MAIAILPIPDVSQHNNEPESVQPFFAKKGCLLYTKQSPWVFYNLISLYLQQEINLSSLTP